VWRSSEGCGVAQLVVRRLAVMQARVRISARHPMEVPLAELRSDEDTVQEDRPQRMVKDERKYDCIVRMNVTNNKS
jgi:hypothetical protein